jgi:hypothetical protein
MTKYPSFISEHTAEFVLVPQLTKILRQKFEVVVPIFPWLNREGNTFARSIHKQDKFHIVGLYSKRPKLNEESDKFVIKINHEFIAGASQASKVNIPMIVGCPLIKKLWDLNENTNCIWIKLTETTKDFYYIECEDKLSNKLNFLQNTEIFNKNDDLLNFVVKNSKKVDYENFIYDIRNIRANSPVFFMGFGIYKPVYFLLKVNK